MRRTLIFCAIALVFLPAGCSTPKYRGYKYGPYSVRGRYYEPMDPRAALGFTEEGVASHFNEHRLIFFSGRSALGERQWGWSRAAAHKTLPLPCRIRVTNLRNGKSTTVRVNDRGPFIGDRILDVTPRVAKELGFHAAGLAPVRIQVLSVGDGRYRIR